MPSTAELNQLWSHVEFDPELQYVDGLFPFRNFLEKDVDGRVLKFLKRKMPKLDDERRCAVGFVIAEHFRQTGNVKGLRKLFETDDAEFKSSVLNSLWDEPGDNPQMGPAIVEMALEGTKHTSPDVRTEACFVIMNQCAWKVNV